MNCHFCRLCLINRLQAAAGSLDASALRAMPPRSFGVPRKNCGPSCPRPISQERRPPQQFGISRSMYAIARLTLILFTANFLATPLYMPKMQTIFLKSQLLVADLCRPRRQNHTVSEAVHRLRCLPWQRRGPNSRSRHRTVWVSQKSPRPHR